VAPPARDPCQATPVGRLTFPVKPAASSSGEVSRETPGDALVSRETLRGPAGQSAADSLTTGRLREIMSARERASRERGSPHTRMAPAENDQRGRGLRALASRRRRGAASEPETAAADAQPEVEPPQAPPEAEGAPMTEVPAPDGDAHQAAVPGGGPDTDDPVADAVAEAPSPAAPFEAPALDAADGATRQILEHAHDDPGPMELPRVLAIANQKGGVGKTTTAVNLGSALAEAGYRVLVVDLDPQGNASTGLGVNPRDLDSSVYDVMMSDAPLDDCIEPTSLKNLFVAPSTIDLAGAEIELVPAMSRELKLRKAIDNIRDDYDLVLIDCPPSLGLLTVNGLAAADDVIVPIQCEYYALEGLGQLLRNVGLVRGNLNPNLDVRGIVLTMYDARTKLADQVEAEVRVHFGPKVYETVVPRTVRLSEAPSFGQPIIVFDPNSRGAQAYRDLAKEVSRGATRRAR
jgi:chromosome partitioning protein